MRRAPAAGVLARVLLVPATSWGDGGAGEDQPTDGEEVEVRREAKEGRKRQRKKNELRACQRLGKGWIPMYMLKRVIERAGPPKPMIGIYNGVLIVDTP